MTKRLTPERERFIREKFVYNWKGYDYIGDDAPNAVVNDLLAEIDALQAELEQFTELKIRHHDVVRERDQCLEDYKTLNARSIDLELEVLRAELDDARSTRLAIQVEQLKEENQKLREALEFYADEKNHTIWTVSGLDVDKGKRAREALGKKK